MQTNKRYLAETAERMRNIQLPENPMRHEWVELATLLSQMDSPHLREIGLEGLARHAKQELSFKTDSERGKNKS